MSKDNDLYYELKNEVDELKDILHSKTNKMEIVIAGNVKAGKSTLINALFNDNSLCKTGEVRTTSENQVIESELYRIIDTPGINANEQDTEIAKKGYKQSEFFIFVHNIIDGELLAREVDFIKELQSYFKDDIQFSEGIVIVLTNAGQVEQENIKLTKEKIQEQLLLITKECLTIMVVDSISYLNGIESEKEILIEYSQIPVLQSYLEQAALNFSKDLKSRRTEINHVRKKELKEKISNQHLILQKRYQAFGQSQESLVKLKSLVKDIDDLHKLVTDNFNMKMVRSHHYCSTYISVQLPYKDVYSNHSYSSYSKAERDGLEMIRNKVIPKAERAYLERRREIINSYKRLLPNFEGDESVIAVLKNKVEDKLIEQKKKLAGLHGEFDFKKIADKKIFLDLYTFENKSKTTSTSELSSLLESFSGRRNEDGASTIKRLENKLAQTSYVHASSLDSDYEVESASSYEYLIDTDYMTEYRSSFFGEKEIEKYRYNLSSVITQVEKDATRSCESLKRNIEGVIDEIVSLYRENLVEQVKSILMIWREEIEKNIQEFEEEEKKKKGALNSLNKSMNEMNQLQAELSAV